MFKKSCNNKERKIEEAQLKWSGECPEVVDVTLIEAHHELIVTQSRTDCPRIQKERHCPKRSGKIGMINAVKIWPISSLTGALWMIDGYPPKSKFYIKNKT